MTSIDKSEIRLAHQIISELNTAILVEDDNRKLMIVNKSFTKMFGIPYDPSEMIGYNCAEAAEVSKSLFADPEYFISRISHILVKKLLVVNELVRLKSGRILLRDYIPIYIDDKYLGHIWSYQDITKIDQQRSKIYEQSLLLEQQNLDLKRLSFTDSLTGIFNRRYLMDTLSQLITTTLSQKSPFGIILIDIDNFKVINDNFGHLKGDEILINTTKVIQNSISKQEIFCRYGGEEFCILVTNTSENQLKEMAERIRRDVEKISITISLGTVVIDSLLSDRLTVKQYINTILKEVDQNLYTAKNRGKNLVASSILRFTKEA